MTDLHSILLVALVSIITAILRFLPFWVFRNRETPRYITYLGRVLPYAIMGMLVVYCLKNVSFVAVPFAIPELLSCAVVILMHIWRRNTLLSIISGTAVYMILIQFVF